MSTTLTFPMIFAKAVTSWLAVHGGDPRRWHYLGRARGSDSMMRIVFREDSDALHFKMTFNDDFEWAKGIDENTYPAIYEMWANNALAASYGMPALEVLSNLNAEFAAANTAIWAGQ